MIKSHHEPINFIIVTKEDVVREVAKQVGSEKAKVYAILESFFDVVKDSLSQGENIYIRGFGTFSNKKRAEKAVHHFTNTTFTVVEARLLPSFKPSKSFAGRVKEKYKSK